MPSLPIPLIERLNTSVNTDIKALSDPHAAIAKQLSPTILVKAEHLRCHDVVRYYQGNETFVVRRAELSEVRGKKVVVIQCDARDITVSPYSWFYINRLQDS
jgi:hypothetical protein